jgi:putative ABC transport system ATP-binding protein
MTITTVPVRTMASPRANGGGSRHLGASVELRSLGKHFGRRRHGNDALVDVTATFAAGTITAVVGPSGSGKSTLLQCAAGLDRPTSGAVSLGRTDLGGLSRRRLAVLRRRRVGFVFQSLNLVPTLSVAENIALPLRLDRRHVDRNTVRRLADRVGIAAELRRLPSRLSGGQQQRVAIARALITDPEVIFADEPTAALDPYNSDVVIELLRQAAKEFGRTVVVVTHEPRVAARTDRALVLDRGRLVGTIDAPTAADLEFNFGSLEGQLP